MNLSAAVVVLALLVSVPAAAQDKLTILSTSLQEGNCGVPYVATLNVSGGDRATLRWSIINGRLPRGLTLTSDSNAKLYGTPIEAGSFPLVLRVEDGERDFDEARFVIHVGQVPIPPYCPEGPGGSGGGGGSSPVGGSGGTADSMGGGTGGGGGTAGSTGAGAGGRETGERNGGGSVGGDSFRHVNRAPSGCECDAGSGGPGAIALLALARRRRR